MTRNQGGRARTLRCSGSRARRIERTGAKPEGRRNVVLSLLLYFRPHTLHSYDNRQGYTQSHTRDVACVRAHARARCGGGGVARCVWPSRCAQVVHARRVPRPATMPATERSAPVGRRSSHRTTRDTPARARPSTAHRNGCADNRSPNGRVHLLRSIISFRNEPTQSPKSTSQPRDRREVSCVLRALIRAHSHTHT